MQIVHLQITLNIHDPHGGCHIRRTIYDLHDDYRIYHATRDVLSADGDSPEAVLRVDVPADDGILDPQAVLRADVPAGDGSLDPQVSAPEPYVLAVGQEVSFFVLVSVVDKSALQLLQR